MARTTSERISNIETEIQQLENQRKKLLQQQKETDRKARTKRLIERGAILESLISDAPTFTNDQIKSFLEKTVQSDYARKILNGITKQGGEAAAVKAPWTARNSVAASVEKTESAGLGGD